MSSARTPLMDACRAGNIEEVRRLLAEGADPNARNANGTTPFMYAKTAAFGSGDMTIMRMLVAAGADVGAKDRFGRTALDYAKANAARVIGFIEQAMEARP